MDVRELPRLAGFRAHVRFPAYTGLPPETITGGTGDVAALLGSEVDLRILVKRPLEQALVTPVTLVQNWTEGLGD